MKKLYLSLSVIIILLCVVFLLSFIAAIDNPSHFEEGLLYLSAAVAFYLIMESIKVIENKISKS
ncbi:MAG: hypothetical protein K8Q99_02795 [Acholeplasmataceae bacterium]|nr:hypothetical protein [Acholeplasmataceae bacterium]